MCGVRLRSDECRQMLRSRSRLQETYHRYLLHKNIAVFLWIASRSIWESDGVRASVLAVPHKKVVAVNQNQTTMIIYVH